MFEIYTRDQIKIEEVDSQGSEENKQCCALLNSETHPSVEKTARAKVNSRVLAYKFNPHPSIGLRKSILKIISGLQK